VLFRSQACTNIVDSAAAGTTDVTFTGWLEELDHRFVRGSEVPNLIFSGVVGGTIVSNLLTQVNAQQDSTGVTRPTHLTIGSVTDTQTRTRSYKVGDSYGQLVRELVEIENGLDLYVDPITRKLSTRPPTAYVDRKNVRFGYRVDPGNLADAVVTEDGLAIANRENVVAAGGVTYSVDDQAAISAAGIMLEEQQSLSDVQSATVATAFAAAELAYKRLGIVTYALSVKQYGDIPRPWDDFELGDKVYFSANRGRMQIYDQAVRVFSLSIDIDDNGNEVISELGVAP